MSWSLSRNLYGIKKNVVTRQINHSRHNKKRVEKGQVITCGWCFSCIIHCLESLSWVWIFGSCVQLL